MNDVASRIGARAAAMRDNGTVTITHRSLAALSGRGDTSTRRHLCKHASTIPDPRRGSSIRRISIVATTRAAHGSRIDAAREPSFSTAIDETAHEFTMELRATDRHDQLRIALGGSSARPTNLFGSEWSATVTDQLQPIVSVAAIGGASYTSGVVLATHCYLSQPTLIRRASTK